MELLDDTTKDEYRFSGKKFKHFSRRIKEIQGESTKSFFDMFLYTFFI